MITFSRLIKMYKLENGRFFVRGDKAVAIIGRNIAFPPKEDEQLIGIGDRIKLVVRVRGEPKEITLRVSRYSGGAWYQCLG